MPICREMLDKSLGRISSEESLCQEPSSSNGVALRALPQSFQSQRETVEPVSSSNVAGLPFCFPSIYKAKLKGKPATLLLDTRSTVSERKSTRLDSSHQNNSYSLFFLKKKKKKDKERQSH